MLKKDMEGSCDPLAPEELWEKAANVMRLLVGMSTREARDVLRFAFDAVGTLSVVPAATDSPPADSVLTADYADALERFVGLQSAMYARLGTPVSAPQPLPSQQSPHPPERDDHRVLGQDFGDLGAKQSPQPKPCETPALHHQSPGTSDKNLQDPLEAVRFLFLALQSVLRLT